MKNIVLTRALSTSSDADFLRGCKLFVEDSSTRTAYFVGENGIVILDENLNLKADIPCSDQFDCFDPISLDLLQDRNELCIILQNAQVVTMDVESQAICTGCFLGETCSAAAWSPDMTVLTVAEDTRIVFYDRSFEIVGHWEMSTSDNGNDALVAVGWGAAETQFQGSAGKTAREKVKISRTAYPDDSHNSYIRWRADGSYVMVSFYERESDERRIAVLNREGELMALLKNNEPMEEVFAVRPSGNCIATTKRSTEGVRTLVFYERNGEKRREVPLSHAADQNRLLGMEWDVGSLCLCIHVQCNQQEELQLWTESNYDWRHQWTVSFNQQISNWKWDTEKARHLCVLLCDGAYMRLYFAYTPAIAGSTALVVAGDELRLTDLGQRLIPPPMSEYAIPLKGATQAFAFEESRLAVVDSNFALHLREPYYAVVNVKDCYKHQPGYVGESKFLYKVGLARLSRAVRGPGRHRFIAAMNEEVMQN
ncbi:hypothetical protein KIN20_006442 [Parelaphostrongylus tenuis]|uniref:ELP1 first N-terminal beta-propeller domain-containing protein n=1 Tax=Parelaphostrongylus tenuis TaxID=148309 RepID=A0AAD5M628_PARTN|nr:hypothetical protein KIN20_006442 [Parelaphostrongylus tenuis]